MTKTELANEIISALHGHYRLLVYKCDDEIRTISHFGTLTLMDCHYIEDINVNTSNWDIPEEDLDYEIEDWRIDKAQEIFNKEF